MDRIGMVIDLEWNTYMKQPMIREIGYTMRDGDTGSYAIWPSKRFHQIWPVDRDTAWWARDKYHGLPYYPTGECRGPASVYEIVKGLYERSLWLNGGPYVVAYKGGHVERDILHRLGIDSVNLEDYGCMKYKDLRSTQNFEVTGCDEHVFTDSVHCPMAETQSFMGFVLGGHPPPFYRGIPLPDLDM